MAEEAHYVSILFSDIKGYSKLKNDRLYALLTEFNDDFKGKYLDSRNHFLCKVQGDGFMICSNTPDDAADIALNMRHEFRKTHWEKQGFSYPLSVRIGLHFGKVTLSIKDGKIDDVSGEHVITAARIEPIVEPNQIYCSDSFYQTLSKEKNPNLKWVPLGKQKLAKDFGEMDLYSLFWEHETTRTEKKKSHELHKPGQQILAVVRYQLLNRTIQDGNVTDTSSINVPEDLGPLRSVWEGSFDEKDVLLVGARQGVWMLEKSGKVIQCFRFPKNEKQGNNAVSHAVISNGDLIACHRNYGLWKWPLDSDQANTTGECISSTARTFDSDSNGRLWIVRGKSLLSLNNGYLQEVMRGDTIILSVAVGKNNLYILDNNGRLLRWPKESITHTPSLMKRIIQPGYSINRMEMDENEFLIFTDGMQVICQATQEDNIKTFRGAEEEMALGYGKNGMVVGLNWGEDPNKPRPTTAYIWKWDQPNQPLMRWAVKKETGHHLQDILCWE